MIELVCATANPHKVEEIAAELSDAVVLLPRPVDLGDIVEDAPDLTGNALLKARAVCAHTDKAALADDTGLEVDVLNGAPGVLSSRYAGPNASYADNTAKLLQELADLDNRAARFRTVMAVVYPDGTEILAEGVVEGQITTSVRGNAGFGYDPVFVPAEGDGRTFAEMTLEEKNQLSHRTRSLHTLLAKLSHDPARTQTW